MYYTHIQKNNNSRFSISNLFQTNTVTKSLELEYPEKWMLQNALEHESVTTGNHICIWKTRVSWRALVRVHNIQK